ncbi:MAG: 16S rRNA (cytidine(1402)-2'-O)-methyltransferase [Deltaproteobacteria bacterium]|nr:16S rRNA (cytidine(1402)-2'-O)-methyltransferase [Deltaproteobacteria bacterium]
MCGSPRSPAKSAGVLYIVATPIGNDDDISVRAIRVLSEVDLIACEDTRRTARLLAAHSIRTPTMSYFEHNEARRIPELVMRLRSGASIALTSDAGTPTISDPGYRLVRSSIDAGIHVTAVPGACAAIAALAVAGLPTDRFAFEGFLPLKTGARARMLAQLATEARTLVIYEAARRLRHLLLELMAAFGPARRVAVIREGTKTHEEIVRGSLAELAEIFASRPLLGEVTLVIEGAHGPGRAVRSTLEHQEIIDVLREAGLSLKDAAAAASKIAGVSRRQIYQAALTSEEQHDRD